MRNKLAFVFALGVLSGCEIEPVEPGKETSVKGRVYDGWNDQPVQGFKLRVAEYMEHRAGLTIIPYFVQFIDSTYTAADGSYSLSFRTTGKGNYYTLDHERSGRYAQKPWTGSGDLKVGKANNADFDFERTVTLKARLVVHGNTSPPLKVRFTLGSNYYSYFYLPEIPGTDNDVVLYFPLSRNAGNRIEFYVHDDPSYSKRRTQEEIVEVGNVEPDDTLEQIFHLYPSQFK